MPLVITAPTYEISPEKPPASDMLDAVASLSCRFASMTTARPQNEAHQKAMSTVLSYLQDLDDYFLLRTKTEKERAVKGWQSMMGLFRSNPSAEHRKENLSLPGGTFAPRLGVSAAASRLHTGWKQYMGSDETEKMEESGAFTAMCAAYIVAFSDACPADIDYILAFDAADERAVSSAKELVGAGACLVYDETGAVGEAIVNGGIAIEQNASFEPVPVIFRWDERTMPAEAKALVDRSAAAGRLREASRRLWSKMQVSESGYGNYQNLSEDYILRALRKMVEAVCFGQVPAQLGEATLDECFEDMKDVYSRSFLPVPTESYGYRGGDEAQPVEVMIGKATDCIAIWRMMLSRVGMRPDICIRHGDEAEYERVLGEMQEAGRLLGIDTAVDAYLSGAPLEAVIGTDDPWAVLK